MVVPEAVLEEDDDDPEARGWELEPKAERGGNGFDVDLEVDDDDGVGTATSVGGRPLRASFRRC